MVKKGLLLLVLAVVVAGGVFAQTNFASMPKNTVIVDVGPTILGLAFGQAGNLLGNLMGEDMPGINSNGFGIAAQYERQLFSQLGVAGRFSYLGVGLNMVENYTEDGVSVNSSIGLDLTALSAEGHARFYPAGRTFFVGGMLGYGNLKIDMAVEATARDIITGESESEKISLTAPRNYAKVGARLGWRIDFGKPGGFVFEPSFGYDHAFGFGDTFGKRLEDATDMDIDMSDLDEMLKILESYVFVGGPRVTLGFGWRF